MRCPFCHHDNRPDRRFCTQCGAKLATGCPSCGAPIEAGEKFCGGCGAALTIGGRTTTPSPARAPLLADKIRQAKGTIEGERKQVTVLFVDVKGSMELAEQLDPEAWSELMQRFFRIFCDGIERFEGFVAKFTGDGGMALFGAPIAHEDHAQRACYAALHLRDAARAYASEVHTEHGLPFAVRIGLNSGEVVVGRIGEDLRMEFTAQGHVVGLAQRMEAHAESGHVCLSEHTARLVEGYFRLQDLGQRTVKGVSEPVWLFDLEGRRVVPHPFRSLAGPRALRVRRSRPWSVGNLKALERPLHQHSPTACAPLLPSTPTLRALESLLEPQAQSDSDTPPKEPLLHQIAQLGRARDGCGHLTDAGPTVRSRASDHRGKEAPRVRNALEFVLAALAERDAGARDEILDRAGDQDFVGTRQRTDASGDVNRETGEIVAADLALSRVQARSHIDPEGLGGFGDGLGAMNGARRAVEAGQKTIPGRLDLPTAEAAQFVADCSVVRVQKGAPPLVAFRRGSLGGRDDVGEEYGGQNAVDLSRRSLPGEELGDLADHRLVVATKEESIVAGYLDQASAINVSGEVACSLGIGVAVVQHQRRGLNRGEYTTNVELAADVAVQSTGHAWRRRRPAQPGQRSQDGLIAGKAGK